MKMISINFQTLPMVIFRFIPKYFNRLSPNRKDHLIAIIAAITCYLPFALSGASHDGFEDIEYSFVPLFDWFYSQLNGHFEPVNFLWELGWSAPLAHGAWAFPGNMFLKLISAKTYFFLFYCAHLYLSVYGFLGICRIYKASRIYGLIAAGLLSFLPPQGWYVFVHDAPTVLASIQLAPTLIYLYLRLNIAHQGQIKQNSAFLYYSAALGLVAAYLVNSGHPGMFYPYYAAPLLTALFLVRRQHGSFIDPIKLVIPAILVALVLSLPKLISYWGVYSVQAFNLIERVVYDVNPSRHENFWFQSIVYPYQAISNLNTESIYHLYFYLARHTRYLPIIGIIFIVSLVISRKTFIYSLGCLLFTIILQQLYMHGLRLGASGANHFFEGFIAASLIFAVSQAPHIYARSLVSLVIGFLCSLLIVFMVGQQLGFKKYSSGFLNSTSSSRTSSKFLLSEKEGIGLNKGERVILTKKFESILRKQKLKHRFAHATSFSLDGFNNVSMFGKGVAGEPVYPSFRQGYSSLTLEILTKTLGLASNEDVDFYLSALEIKGVIDSRKKSDPRWQLIDKKRNVVFRSIQKQYSTQERSKYFPSSDKPTAECLDALKCVLKFSIMQASNAQAKFSKKEATFALDSSIEALFTALPIRYRKNLKIVSNTSREIAFENCSGLVCLTLSKNTEIITVSSKITFLYTYLLVCIYFIMLSSMFLWFYSMARGPHSQLTIKARAL
jgi:hypothetical protein